MTPPGCCSPTYGQSGRLVRPRCSRRLCRIREAHRCRGRGDVLAYPDADIVYVDCGASVTGRSSTTTVAWLPDKSDGTVTATPASGRPSTRTGRRHSRWPVLLHRARAAHHHVDGRPTQYRCRGRGDNGDSDRLVFWLNEAGPILKDGQPAGAISGIRSSCGGTCSTRP
jgi:hypothetical protein